MLKTTKYSVPLSDGGRFEIKRTYDPLYQPRGYDVTVEKNYDKFGRLHRTDGPAFAATGVHGSTVTKHYVDGLLSNTKGPAVVVYKNNGDRIIEEWWIAGVMCTQEEIDILSDDPLRPAHFHFNEQSHPERDRETRTEIFRGARPIAREQNGTLPVYEQWCEPPKTATAAWPSNGRTRTGWDIYDEAFDNRPELSGIARRAYEREKETIRNRELDEARIKTNKSFDEHMDEVNWRRKTWWSRPGDGR